MDSIQDSWDRIVNWLRQHSPDSLKHIAAPAGDSELQTAAAQLGRVPDSFRELYRICNGTEGVGLFPSHDDWDDMAYELLDLEGVVNNWKIWKELLESGDFADLKPESATGIAAEWWHVGWIPFADNGGGDCFCLDMAPTSAGVAGQVISHSHETGEHQVLAPSLEEYLKLLAADMEAGRYRFDAEQGVVLTPDSTAD